MPHLELESQYPGKIVVGVDEVGRGALAGPVVAGAVIIDSQHIIPGIKDSKLLTPRKREYLYHHIVNNYVYSIGIASVQEIDKFNILEATKIACVRAINQIPVHNIILIDGNMKFSKAHFIEIIKGDRISLSIAAASIIAKVTRDRIMYHLSHEYSLYSWYKNVGYGTKEHIAAIKQHGLSVHHRRSFKLQNV